MSHTPPVPAANQSPYPLHEAPHAKVPAVSPPPGDTRIAKTPSLQSVPAPSFLAIAAGVGLAALAGGLFWAFSESKPKPKKKRKPAKRAPKSV